MQTLLRDLLHGARLFRRQPLFYLTSVGVLAIGLGANLTIFSIVNGLLLHPITPDHADRLVGIYSRDTAQPDSYRSFSYPNYLDVRGARTVFQDVLAHAPSTVGVTEGETTRRVLGDFVTANFFATLGAPLARGRAFADAEEKPGSNAAVVVISDALFGRMGRPGDVLSRTLRLNGRDYAIIGVAPAWFTGTTALASPELWLPLGEYDRSGGELREESRRPMNDRTNHLLFLVGRLKPGVSREDANRALAGLAARMAADQPDVNAHQELSAYPAARMSISTHPPSEGGLAIASVLLLSVATVVLVIACLNVSTLLLSRGMARRRDIAIRLAIGASRGRIVRQLLVEGAALATVACTIGIALASRASQALFATIQAIAPLPLVFTAGPDRRMIAAAVAWTALSTLLFAAGPAFRLTSGDVMDDLQRRSPFAARRSWRRTFSGTNLLVVAQLALSLVLLTTAGLFLRGAARSIAAPLGFSIDGEVVALIDPALGGATPERAHQLTQLAIDRVRAMPGVAAASLASTIPFGDTNEGRRIAADAATRREDRTLANFTVVGRDYFRTLGVAVVSGREFTDAEERGLPSGRIAILDQLAAKRIWPGGDAVGRVVYVTRGRGEPDALTVVGVVTPIRRDLVGDPEPALYIPSGQEPRTMVAIHARVAPGSDTAMLAAVRTAIAGVDRGFPILKLASLRTVRDESASMWMVMTSGRIFGALGALAALLAIVGLYAVVAYVVSRRVKEIGIRMAIGATRRDVLLLVVRDGAVLTAAGLGAGFALSLGAVQAVRAAAAAVAVADATVFAVPPVLLAAAALVASLVPAARAASLPPTVALREE